MELLITVGILIAIIIIVLVLALVMDCLKKIDRENDGEPPIF